MTKKGNYITCQKCKYKFKIYNKIERQEWRKNKYKCPICGELYCNKPKTERDLFNLQDSYLKLKDPLIFEEMIYILLEYSKSIILRYYSNYISSEKTLKYYSDNSIAFLIEEYLSKDNFYITDSFGGLLTRKVKQAIFRKDELDIPGISLNWDFDDGNEIEYEDNKYNFIDNLEKEESHLNLYKYVKELIFGIEKFCSPAEDYKRLLAIRNYFNSGEKSADLLFQEKIENDNGEIIQFKTYGRLAKEKYLNTLDFLKKELMSMNNFHN